MVEFPDRLPIPPEVEKIAHRLDAAGYETWCVGGAIRDNLMQVPNKDFDLATAARPEEVREIFGHRRTIPVGMDHGTVAVLDSSRQTHEVTTFRRDVRTDGRHAVVEFGASLDQDLARRDFTINAIAYHPFRFEWKDPFSGREDLAARIVRAVGDPRQRFREDYLRILRALRFASRFGFAIEVHTRAAAEAEVQGLTVLSAERVREEWLRGLAGSQRPSAFVLQWRDLGALDLWLPEVAAHLKAFRGWERLADALPKDDPVLLTSVLSADPERTLDRLRCANAQIERGRRFARFRGQLPDVPDTVSVRRWLAHVGPAADDLITVAEAQGADALRGAVEIERRKGAALTIRDLAVNGTDLMEAGVPEGPEVRRVLEQLLEAVLEAPSLNDRDVLLARVPALMTATKDRA
jgi:tRNA nucleotidyltransferase (CCA-adding enzyme)